MSQDHDPTFSTVTVELGARSYDALIGAGILDLLGTSLRTATSAAAALLVADEALPLGTLETAERSLAAAGLRHRLVTIHASERAKTLDTAAAILEEAAAARLERTDAIVAIGGGIVGDIAGFAASTYRRGIAVVQCPTTLLAMVDAAVGGKTAVNLIVGEHDPADPEPGGRLLKNMAGTFHQPRLVLADVRTLATLPRRQVRAGLAECLKHALIAADVGHPPRTDRFADSAAAVVAGRASEADLTQLVAWNIAVKAAFVSRDERETPAPDADFPGREALNLGHTFAHALEALEHLAPDDNPAHAPLAHGEAVALGLVAAAAAAEASGTIEAGSAERVRAMATAAGLPTRIAGIPADDAVIASMLDDKKVRAGRLRLVLPWQQLGHVRIADGPGDLAIRAGIAAIREL